MSILYKRLQKQKFVTALKVISIGIGLSCSVILFFVAHNQFRTDTFYHDKEQIFQVFERYTTPNDNSLSCIIRHPVAKSMMDDFPQIEYGTTVRNDWTSPYVVDNNIIEARTYYADSLFFKVFDRECIYGDAASSLKSVNTAIITQSLASKLFGDKSPINQTLLYRNDRLIEVKAVIEDWPINSSIKAEVILSFETLKAEDRLYMGWNGGDSFRGFVKLRPESKVKVLEANFPQFVSKYLNLEKLKQDGYNLEYELVPLTKSHLKDNSQLAAQLLILVLLGSLLLTLVCFNTYLLTVSQQNRMRKELTVRRVNGSSYNHVMYLLFKDALFQFGLSLMVAFIIVWGLTPMLLSFFKGSVISAISNLAFISIFLAVSGIIFLAIFLIPSFKTLSKIKSERDKAITSSKTAFADFPLAFQVGISFVLMVFFWFVYQQLSYVQTVDKGFDSDGLAYVELASEHLYKNYKTIKKEVSNIPGVDMVAISDDIPVYGLSGNMFGKDPGGANCISFRHLYVDEDFFKTLDIKTLGEGFQPLSGSENKVVITELVAEELGIDNPLHQNIYQSRGRQHFIAGVAKDIISSGSVHSKMQGIVFSQFHEPDCYTMLSCKINTHTLLSTSAQIKNKIEQLVPGSIVEVKYYNNDILDAYKLDFAIKKAVSFFALIAGILTLAGIVGFSVNLVQKRIKEIGIRKVNGATELSILILLNRNFITKTSITLLFFVPLTWWLINSWLQNYAYHIPMNYLVFPVFLLAILLVVFTTVTVAVWNNINRNPIETLHYE